MLQRKLTKIHAVRSRYHMASWQHRESSVRKVQS